jgi:tetratricopeptide (TPR) repeat protein
MYNIFSPQATLGRVFLYSGLCILLLHIFLPAARPALGAEFSAFRTVRPAAGVFPAKQDTEQSGHENYAEGGPRSGFVINVNVPFGYGLSKDLARDAAVSGARILAAGRLALELEKEAALLGLPGFEGADKAELLFLSYALLAGEYAALDPVDPAGTEIPAQPSSGNGPPGPAGVLQLTYRCAVPDRASLRKACAWMFGTPVVLESHRLAAQMERELYAGYLKAGREYLQEAGAACSGVPPELMATLDSLRALRIYFELLPSLYPEDPSPGNPRELQARLEEAAALMPANYLLLSELGRLYAWMEQTDKAALALSEAIRLNPDFARSYSRRSALLLLLRKHSLALADLDRALRLSGGEAEYYYERAVVWLAMGNKEAMCADLRASCLAGDCRSHEWAAAAGECD